MRQTVKNKKILVIKNRAIGDAVILTGILRVLKQNKPNYDIDVIVKHPSGTLLEGLPFIKKAISISEPKNKFDRFTYWLRLVRRLRTTHYEMVLVFHASIKTAFFSKLLRTKIVVANHHDLTSKNWFSDLPVPNRGIVKSIIDRDLDLLRAIGIHATPSEAWPELVLSDYEKNEAKKFITKSLSNPENQNDLKVFLGIGASRATKRYPAHMFFELINLMNQKRKTQFFIAAIDEDNVWLDSFSYLLKHDSSLQDRVHIFKNMPLRKVAGIISCCDVYVGNDSGLKHIAVALGLSSFTFFGPELPLEWHPYDTNKHKYAFISNLECRTESGKHWCSIPVCEKHEHRCMQHIFPQNIIDDVMKICEKKNNEA